MIGLLLVAVSVGLSNFAASIGIGVAGTSARVRLRVGVVFGLFEGGMPVAGLALGQHLARTLGGASRWFGAALLMAAGTYGLVRALRTPHGPAAAPEGVAAGQMGLGRLLLAAVALSADNLTVGFALGGYHVNLAVAALVFAAVSVGLSLLGLELGGRLGARSQRNGEAVGGLILIGVGAVILFGVM